MAKAQRDQWEYCQIERLVARVQWWSRRRVGVFVAVQRGAGHDRPFARSPSFPIPSPNDADITALHAFRAHLIAEGWEVGQKPAIALGLTIFRTGYWHYTLRRKIGVALSLPPAVPPPGLPITTAWEAEPPPFFTLPPEMFPPDRADRTRGTENGRSLVVS